MGQKTRSKALRQLSLRELRSSALRHMGYVRRVAYELPDYLNDIEEDELGDLAMQLGDLKWDAMRAVEYLDELCRREEAKR
jgi:hypothetical protein